MAAAPARAVLQDTGLACCAPLPSVWLWALEQEQARLQQNYDSSIDLVAVREQAQALGMREPRPDQIVYLHLSGADHAVITPAGSKRSTILTVLQEFFLGILE